MRIAIVVDESPLSTGQEVVAKQWMEILPCLKDYGAEIEFVTLRTCGLVNHRIRSLGISTASLRCPKLVLMPLAVLRLVRCLRKQRPFDVVHGSEVIPAFIAGVAGLFVDRAPRIYHRHHSTGGKRLRLASWLAARVTTHTWVSSAAVARCARKLDQTPDSRIHLIPGYAKREDRVERERPEAIRSRLSISANSHVALIPARLRKDKAIDVGIIAIEILRKEWGLPLDLVIAGTGPRREALEKLCRSRDIFGVHFVGHQIDLGPYFQLSEVVVLPSLREPFGLVLIEAMAYGRPIVATNVEGPSEIVTPEVGLLVTPGNPYALADGLAKILLDSELSKSMGREGRKRYEALYTERQAAANWMRAWNRATTDAKR